MFENNSVNLANQLSDLLLPTRCAICNEFPSPLCELCFERIQLRPRQISRSGIQGITFTEYKDDIANLLNAFKEQGQRRIGQRLALELTHHLSKPKVDFLLPVPSKALSFADRGFNPAKVLAGTLGKCWRLAVAESHFIRQPKDQVGLGRAERQQNLHESIKLSQRFSGARVMLVDDIVTSGATITELARAARAVGAVVLGFITIAESVPKPPTLNSKKV